MDSYLCTLKQMKVSYWMDVRCMEIIRYLSPDRHSPKHMNRGVVRSQHSDENQQSSSPRLIQPLATGPRPELDVEVAESEVRRLDVDDSPLSLSRSRRLRRGAIPIIVFIALALCANGEKI